MYSTHIPLFRVKGWADQIGSELWHLGDYITRRKEVQEVKSFTIIVHT